MPTDMSYSRADALVVQRSYDYDILGRPTARNLARYGTQTSDTFGYNTRSESPRRLGGGLDNARSGIAPKGRAGNGVPASQLTTAHVNSADYSYAYDAIGNRTSATEAGTRTAYTANKLNQYTAEGSFRPTFDADGNQTLIKTSTGTWNVTYNAKNRPIRFVKSDNSVTVECTYDTMGRRATKKVTTNGALTEHRRFLYRGYLQIDSPPPHRRLTPAGQSRFAHCPTGLTAVGRLDSPPPHRRLTPSGQSRFAHCPTGLTAVGRLACCDLTRAYTPALWFITWESPRRLGGGLDKHEVFAPKGRKHPTAVRVIRQCRRHCPRQGASCREAAASQRRNGVPASQPTQETTTRPLAIQKNGTWYSAPARLASQGSRSQVCSRLGVWLLKPHPAYGWDLTKNICETYTPYGEVSPAHAYDQPLRWSSEYHDTELGLVYYNYRHYNPAMGRWMGRNLIEYLNLYNFIQNSAVVKNDYLGLEYLHETIRLPLETIYNERKVIAYTGPRDKNNKKPNTISTKGYTFREFLKLIGTTITHMGYEYECYTSGMEFQMDIVTLIPNDIIYKNSEAMGQLIRHENNRAFAYKEIYTKFLTPLSKFHFKKFATDTETNNYTLGIFQEAKRQIESYISNELGFIYGGGISEENSTAGWKIENNNTVSTEKALRISNNDITRLKNTAVFVGFLGAMHTPKEAKYFTIPNKNMSL